MIRFDLKKKVAIITGGARGLGASIAKTFFKEKAKVIICDVLVDEADEIAKSINGNAFKLDVSNPNEVNLIFNEINESAKKNFRKVFFSRKSNNFGSYFFKSFFLIFHRLRKWRVLTIKTMKVKINPIFL